MGNKEVYTLPLYFENYDMAKRFLDKIIKYVEKHMFISELTYHRLYNPEDRAFIPYAPGYGWMRVEHVHIKKYKGGYTLDMPPMVQIPSFNMN